MQKIRIFGIILFSFFALSDGIFASVSEKETVGAADEKNKTVAVETRSRRQQQLVEAVDIQGNRRLRDEDLLYYIQTRPGDTLDRAQLERDLQSLLVLDFFDKSATRVLTEEGVRGGVNVIFEVRELPIIRDLQFEGTKAVQESDILKAFRENRVGISKESVYNPVKVRNASRTIRELLAAKGYPNAKIDIKEEEVSATSVAITFEIEQGERSRIADIEFVGNEKFKDSELRGQLQYVRKSGLISRFKGQDILDRQKLEYDLNKNVVQYMQSKGYLNARVGEPQVEALGRRRTGLFLPVPFLSSVDDTLRVNVPVTEGKIYRLGNVKIEGNSIFSEQQILAIINLKKGEIVDGKQLREALYETLKKFYGAQGFINYSADLDLDLQDNAANAAEGVANFNISIDEGKQFSLRRLEFAGNTFTRDNVLRREMLINEGDIYNQQAYEYSVLRLNQTGYFDPIDKEKDVEIRTNEEDGTVDLVQKVKERGRQQIQFNGGISGVTGTFFGLEYSTNNLLGRGEVLGLNAGIGNRQTSVQLSFTEPYFRDRPISVGFSFFLFRQKFFGEGTLLSNNVDAQVGAYSTLGFFQTDERNLFTRNTYGATLFASAPLSEFFFLRKRRFTQFSRVGLTYQFSATTIKDPPVNADNNAATFIPTVFRQPNIITSRITPTFVYDSRDYAGDGNDPVKGSRMTLGFSFTGLGGDVRTYQPTVEYISFIPVRRKRSKNPEVFGFRLSVGHIGTFATKDKIRNANSLSFVNGVPIFERYFLGDEYTVRGYGTRTIGPIAPTTSYITSRNVALSQSPSGDIVAPDGGIRSDVVASLLQRGIFTGIGGANSFPMQRSINYVGGDTQLLGNFEYRVPIFGPVSAAAFADIGSAFNLQKGSAQSLNSDFIADDRIVGAGTLTQALLNSNPELSAAYNELLRRLILNQTPVGNITLLPSIAVTPNGELATQTYIRQNLNNLNNIRYLFLRGEVQTNTLIDVPRSASASIGDFRTSIGAELRVQVPVVNVPFRLIFAYNPTAKKTLDVGTFSLPLDEKRFNMRFSVGRTF